VNLGQSDFKRGNREVVFGISKRWFAGMFLCYEIIFPDFVRRRVASGATMLVNLTNDGWWGRSNGPYQHATMSRMRSIENGVSLARCANTGISMLVDPLGRVLCKTGLYERTVLTHALPCYKINTIYTRFGDWVVWVSWIIIGIFLGMVFFKKKGTWGSHIPFL
jgi:apolipoprotein N-acyltransferase